MPFHANDGGEQSQGLGVAREFQQPEEPDRAEPPEVDERGEVERKDREEVDHHVRRDGVPQSPPHGMPVIGVFRRAPQPADVLHGKHRDGQRLEPEELRAVRRVQRVDRLERHGDDVRDYQRDDEVIDVHPDATPAPTSNSP